MSARTKKAPAFPVVPVTEANLSTDPLDLVAAERIIARALKLIDQRFAAGVSLGNPRDASDYLRARLRPLEHEVFACIWLNNRHSVLAFEELFRGTIDGTTVHPREVVKAGLQHNAAAVILAHNHPSGNPEPSAADRAITSQLVEALGLVGIRVLDHLIVGDGQPVSMAARGLM